MTSKYSEQDKALANAIARHRALEDAFVTAKIQEAAGSSTVRKAPITGPNWPVRSDYPNRAAYHQACAEWRRQS
ncbi:DNA polymerase III epsilon subunit-like protein [Sphingomonas trueperi]|uniref:hypothetical protein n=1 Tax=Sphingomonas trueperi TaxID=53317 RepID=UPI003394BB8B